ncbi:AP2 domain protein [Agrobacterium rosae]|uniref:AP2 domain protein n=2 Tax=Agrobacterium rosae TaxID=1972867 RepID=A0A1R3U1N5_9HYPH|nr:AP2 domain protein [Agrobacterium rosae]
MDPSSSHKRSQNSDSADRVSQFHDDAMYAINRVEADRHGQNAWLVNFSRGGRTFQMTFSDGTYGGNEQALTVAKAYRDAVLSVVPPLTKKDMRMQVRKNRSEGSNLPGVYYVQPGNHFKDGAWIARIEVQVEENGNASATKRRRKAISRTFNIGKYGHDEARRLAEEERIRMVLAVENVDEPALRSPDALALHRKLSDTDS